MDFHEAFTKALELAGFSDEELAVRIPVRSLTIYRWKTRRSKPRMDEYQRLREVLPYFADLMDGKAVA